MYLKGLQKQSKLMWALMAINGELEFTYVRQMT